MTSQPTRIPFSLMAKPIGPICNLDCAYCYYLEKEKMYPRNENFRMSDEVLETFVRQYIESQPSNEVTFVWQGGEPTLLGLEFFHKAVALQQHHRGHKTISNALQTNGTLLDDEWCSFFAKHEFLIGLSIDGPRALHDAYRVDKRMKPTFDLILRGLNLLKKHAIPFNTLTVVHDRNSRQPLDVYRFLKSIGSTYLQFIPLVERTPSPEHPDEHAPVTKSSVRAEDYGNFLCAIFDEWVRRDIGKVFVQLFDVTLGNHLNLGSSLCVFAETCGNAVVMEHNGDVFSCDHYVYPEHYIGNIATTNLGDMVNSERQRKFGIDKRDTLPRYCRACEVQHLCHGECPKHRFILTPDGEPGLNYLCPAYRRFFTHVDPAMRAMAELLRNGRPAADIRRRPGAAMS